MKLKKLFTTPRIVVLLVFIILALVAIYPNPTADGVAIRAVKFNSSAAIAGFESPKANVAPMSREVILEINGKKISDVKDYYSLTADLQPEQTLTIKTTKQLYRLTVKPKYKVNILNETEEIFVEEFDEELNQTINVSKIVPKTEKEIIGTEDIGLVVYNAPTSNLRKGFDLEGGTRVLLRPERELTADEMDMVISNMKERLNVYGVSDVIVREASDLSGKQYFSIEIAGITDDEIKDVVARQGKFEAKIGEKTVFRGGNDITYVCRTADCSGIDPRAGCGRAQDGYFCRFFFQISLSPDAAQRQAEATKDLKVISEGDGQYLSEKLTLFLDDKQVDELNIGSDLKGRPVTDIQISGSGAGINQEQAMSDALQNMKKLQTVLITGSLPVKMNIVKIDSITPTFGQEFLNNAILIGILSIIAVSIVVFIGYREWKVSVSMIIAMLSELILLLGFAALIGWNLDLIAIAGIIVAIGTGVDDLIIIADETLKGGGAHIHDWKQKIKLAFFIVFGAYFTSLSGLIPLWFAGAGLVRGFAFVTIVGISLGVFLARPAYARVLEILLKE